MAVKGKRLEIVLDGVPAGQLFQDEHGRLRSSTTTTIAAAPTPPPVAVDAAQPGSIRAQLGGPVPARTAARQRGRPAAMGPALRGIGQQPVRTSLSHDTPPGAPHFGDPAAGGRRPIQVWLVHAPPPSGAGGAVIAGLDLTDSPTR